MENTSIVPPPEVKAPEVTALRQSTRQHQKPSFLQDYHCNLVAGVNSPKSSSSYPLNKYLTYDKISPHKEFILNVSTVF